MTADQVIVEVARIFEIPVSDITGPGRLQHAAWARFVVVRELSSAQPHLSRLALSHAVKRGDHGTALHAIRAYDRLMTSNPTFRTIANQFGRPKP